MGIALFLLIPGIIIDGVVLQIDHPHDDVLKQGDILVKMRMVQHGPRLFIPRGKDAVEALPVPVLAKEVPCQFFAGERTDGLHPLPQGLRNVLRQREGGPARHSALGEESVPFAGRERKGIKPVSVAHRAIGIFFEQDLRVIWQGQAKAVREEGVGGLFRPGC